MQADRRVGSEAMPTVRIFISSPADVAEERAVCLSVLRRLQGLFQGRLILIPILWEQEPLLATAGFQQEIDRRAAPSATDIAVFILWSRMGSPLSKDFAIERGRRPTGTEWEFEDAARGHRKHGVPHLLVYRNAMPPKVDIGDAHLEKRRADFEAVQTFFRSHFQDATDLTFTGSYHTYEEASTFGTVLETHLTKLLGERLAEAPTTVTWHQAPFRGLETFETEHAPIFFGRTRAIQEIREALVRQIAAKRAFVLLLGRSGNGKSSLARAGIVPMLSGPWIVEPGVVGGFCRRAILTPGAARTPMSALVQALLEEEALPDLRLHGSAPELAALFAESPGSVASHVRGALRRMAEKLRVENDLEEVPPARLLLLVDQLEELFTREGVDDVDRNAFTAALDALARSGEVYVLATLRSDFYPAFSRLRTLMDLKGREGQYDLPPMDAAETAQIIRGPAQVAGLTYEVDAKRGRGLDELLIAEATKGPDALPLLEYALTQLEEEKRGSLLTFAAYETMGGLEGAIASRAEAEWKALPEEACRAFPAVLRSLVDVVEGRERTVTRRQAPLEEVAATPGARTFVRRFVHARLLVTRGNDEGAIVAVAHEALLRSWPRMAERIETEGGLLRIRSRVRTQAARWDEKGRDASLLLADGQPLEEARLLGTAAFDVTAREAAFIEASEIRSRRTRRWRRAAVGTIGLLAIGALFLAFFAFSKQREAEGECAAKAAALDDVLRLSDGKGVRDLVNEAESLWPIHPDRAGAMESWLSRAADILAKLPDHERRMATVGARGTRPEREDAAEEGLTWRFDDVRDAWMHEILVDLVGDLDRVAALRPDIQARLEASISLRKVSIEDHAVAWREAIETISASPIYGGLQLVPQLGLVPLGHDPDSQLFEFAHVGSGTVPERNGTVGDLRIEDDSALVLVLIPGGTFWMGAQRDDPKSANFDPQAAGDEQDGNGGAFERDARPFLLSKFECTQAQWKQMTHGLEPSLYKAGEEYGGHTLTLRNPVEQVSWRDCLGKGAGEGWLRRHRLTLPTETQWEYACRARTDTPWFSGDEAGSLQGYANIADAWCKANGGLDSWTYSEEVHDGHSVHAEVGSFRPNAFGLFDMHGNLNEWCGNAYGGYPPIADPLQAGIVFRGGSWVYDARYARSAARFWCDPGLRGNSLGVRPAMAVTR